MNPITVQVAFGVLSFLGFVALCLAMLDFLPEGCVIVGVSVFLIGLFLTFGSVERTNELTRVDDVRTYRVQIAEQRKEVVRRGRFGRYTYTFWDVTDTDGAVHTYESGNIEVTDDAGSEGSYLQTANVRITAVYRSAGWVQALFGSIEELKVPTDEIRSVAALHLAASAGDSVDASPSVSPSPAA